MNMFEQVSSDGHQMSLVGGPCSVRSHVQRGWVPVQWGFISGEGGPCTVRSNASWDAPPPSVHRWMTDTTENITFPQLRWQALITLSITYFKKVSIETETFPFKFIHVLCNLKHFVLFFPIPDQWLLSSLSLWLSLDKDDGCNVKLPTVRLLNAVLHNLQTNIWIWFTLVILYCLTSQTLFGW